MLIVSASRSRPASRPSVLCPHEGFHYLEGVLHFENAYAKGPSTSSSLLRPVGDSLKTHASGYGFRFLKSPIKPSQDSEATAVSCHHPQHMLKNALRRGLTTYVPDTNAVRKVSLQRRQGSEAAMADHRVSTRQNKKLGIRLEELQKMPGVGAGSAAHGRLPARCVEV